MGRKLALGPWGVPGATLPQKKGLRVLSLRRAGFTVHPQGCQQVLGLQGLRATSGSACFQGTLPPAPSPMQPYRS